MVHGSTFHNEQSSKFKATTAKANQSPTEASLKVVLIIAGLLLASAGGVIAYRALYLEPAAAVVITNTDVREVPNTMRVVGGLALLATGAAIAFLAARKRA